MSNPNFPDGPYTTMSALKDVFHDPDVRKKTKRIAIGCGALFVVSSVYLKHRDIVNKAISAQQDCAYETMWASFDEGVRYGLELAKEGVQNIKELGKDTNFDGRATEAKYAFGVFDRPA